MAYVQSPDAALRFGDIVKGVVSATASLIEPITKEGPQKFHIEVAAPPLSVVLSPCCSIGNETIFLSPLIPLDANFFRNPFIGEDPTRINRVMTADLSVPPKRWELMPPEEKAERMARGECYAFSEYFVYEGHQLLPEYELKTKPSVQKTRSYMIDFKRGYELRSKEFQSAKSSPLIMKVLQLTVESRSELRKKLAEYFGRVPQEDIVELASRE